MENELVEKNMGLVYYIARSFQNSTGLEYDDLVQEGMVGLVKAARTFDESRGILFSTYAGRCIQNEILKYLRQQRKHRDKTVSMNILLHGQDKLKIEDFLGTSQNKCENICNQELFRQGISVLNDRQKRIILLYYGLGYKQTELSKQFGISQAQISRSIKKSLEKMRKILGGGWRIIARSSQEL